MYQQVESYKQLKIPTAADLRRGRRKLLLRSPYLFWAIVFYALITLSIMAYLSKSPVFSSEMGLILPGSGSSSSVQIDEVGSAKSQTKSPFNSNAFNPRVNYKEMISGRAVVTRAADKLSIAYEDFGKPKVILTQQTSILAVDVRAGNAGLASDKAWALYEAFQEHLDKLRADEAFRRDQSIMRVLDQYRDRLNKTRQALVEFQQRALLISDDQLGQLTEQISKLDDQILYTRADLQAKEKQVNQLSYDLNVSPDLAGKAFILQTDTQFMGHIKELDESAKQMSEFLSIWGRKHPKVKTGRKRLEKAEKAAFERSAVLLGNGNARVLHNLNLSASAERAALFRDLIEGYAQVKGLVARLDDLRLSKERLNDRLVVSARETKELERLTREYDLAEAVFTSAAADLEAGKADVFASYPVVQMLASPTDPLKQVSPSLKIAIAGGILGYLFVTAVILVIWQRTYILNKLLNR